MESEERNLTVNSSVYVPVKKGSDLSLYVHIPFCLKKCNYCGFYSEEMSGFSGSYPQRVRDGRVARAAGQRAPSNVEKYIEALIAEVKSYGGSFRDRRIVSLYIGGGTPTTLTAGQINKLMSALREEFPLSGNAEITIEANPETLSASKARQLRDIGFNRISIGVQSFHDAALKKLGRVHGSQKAIRAFNACRKAGFSNISIDLMFGYIGQSADAFRSDLKQALLLAPEHISLYALSLDEDSKWSNETVLSDSFENDPERKGGFLLDADLTAEMYDLARSILKGHGYNHYEISNFSKPGYRSRHNEGYWLRREYIGLGASAASLIFNTRPVNPSKIDEYIAMVESVQSVRTKQAFEAVPNVDPTQPVVVEHNFAPHFNTGEISLTPTEIREEIMFLGLRRLSGISRCRMRQYDLYRHFRNEIEELRSLGMIVGKGDIRLSSKALFISNEVLCKFIQAGD